MLSPNSTPKRLYVLNLGKSWKGGEALVPVDCHPEERSDEGSPPFNRGGEKDPPQYPPNEFKVFLGLVGKGVFFPFPIMGDPSLRSGRQSMEEVTDSP